VEIEKQRNQVEPLKEELQNQTEGVFKEKTELEAVFREMRAQVRGF
jgi:hypothetical protein